MRKNLLKISIVTFSFLFFIISFQLKVTGATTELDDTGTIGPDIQLIHSTDKEILLDISVQSYQLLPVNTQNGEAHILKAPEGHPILKAGAPDLPKLSVSVIIPDKEEMQVEIVSADYIELTNIDLAPSKGNLYRNVDPESVPYEYGSIYSKDAFYPGMLSNLGNPYIVRDFRGQTVNFYPYQYNPVSKTLRIVSNLQVRVYATGNEGQNVKNRKNSFVALDSEYENIYKHHFINYSQALGKYDPVGEEGNMLIVAHTEYVDLMGPFVEWKQQKGIPVELVEYSEVASNSAELAGYVAEYYNDNGLTFLLLIGDAEDIPSLYQSGDSDVAYSYIEGNDSYPEFFVGRFSGENDDEVLTQINRSIDYEKYPQPDAGWYSSNVLIGSSEGEGIGDDGESDYEHMQNIRLDLMDFTYTTGYELYDGTQGGEDEPGNPYPDDLADALNAGAGLLAYVGHGSDYSFATTGFSNNDVNALTNDNMLPFIISVACVNGNFHGKTCFAEAWMRATNGDNPTGASAIIASTINQSWAPPMSGQDEMIDILVESYEDNIKRTFGGITMNGCMQMNDDYGADGDEMTDTWTIFGDPSMMVYTAAPTAMTVTHNPVIFIGLNTLQINCDAEDAMAALTFDGELIGTAKVQDGQANILFDPITSVGTATLTITGFNKVPYIAEMDVVPNDGAYVVMEDFSIMDDNNNMADYDEEIQFGFSMKNVGNENASAITAVLYSENEYVEITDSSADFGSIDSSLIVDFENIFTVTIGNNVPNEHMATFTLTLTDDLDSVWTSYFNISINAPEIEVREVGIDDEVGGNGNGRFDAGEVVDLDVAVANMGKAATKEAVMTITTRSDYINIINPEINLGVIDEREVVDTTVTITIDPLTPVGESVNVTFSIEAEEYIGTYAFIRSVGLILEDFETGDFSSYNWDTTYSDTWFVSEEAYEGNFAVKSEDIGNETEATFSIEIDVNADDTLSFYKKVSSESGWDFLRFYIDDTQLGEWSGEVDWSQETYLVEAGTRTLKWTYYKDYTVSSGDDCAWIDYIILPGFTQDSTGGGVDTLFITSTPDTLARMNDIYTYDVTAEYASGADASNLMLACHTMPDWLSMKDNKQGVAVLEGTPDHSDYLGYNDVIICVTNGTMTSWQMFSIMVEPMLSVPSKALTQTNLSIYPNPFSDETTVALRLSEDAFVHVEVLNILGEQINTGLTPNKLSEGAHSFTVNMEHLPDGIYFMNVQINDQRITHRIVKGN